MEWIRQDDDITFCYEAHLSVRIYVAAKNEEDARAEAERQIGAMDFPDVDTDCVSFTITAFDSF
jgi:hypothetical protein